jgi:hypothetical protein
MTQLRQLGPLGHFFECPRWRDGVWWVSGVYDHVVSAVDKDGTSHKVVEVVAQPSGLHKESLLLTTQVDVSRTGLQD